MKTLEKQLKEDVDKLPMEVLLEILEYLGIEDRGGGPEGIYYTHNDVDGEFLFRNLAELVRLIIKP